MIFAYTIPCQSRQTHNSPISSPINHNKKYMKELELATGHTDTEAKILIENEMKLYFQ